MPNYLAPGVYMEELPSGNKPITPASTSVAAFIGVAQKGPVNKATRVTNFAEFEKLFGGPLRVIPGVQEHYLHYMVRHFFEQGGGRAYVVRVIPNTGAALASSMSFDGQRLDKVVPATVPVADALEVEAANQGEWGDELAVRLTNTTPFSVLVAGDAAATDESVILRDNTDVRVGTLLWLVEEVAGTVATVDIGTSTISIEAGMTELNTDPTVAPTAFSGNITDGMTVFGPELEFLARTNLPGNITVDPLNPTPDVILTGITKVDGSNLRVGDSVTFAIIEEFVVVERVSQTPPGAPIPGMLIDFTPGLVNSFLATRSRAYARDFRLDVRLGEDIVETHDGLSLVNADQANHVGDRLGPDGGGSFYIVANDNSGLLDDVEFDNSDFSALQSGADGLTGGNLDAAIIGDDLAKTGIHALDTALDASILCIPNASQAVTADAIGYVENRKDLFYIFEQPSDSTDIDGYRGNFGSQYAAIYHPWLVITDRSGRRVNVPPCGAVAGIYARTDGQRGVHKAPAGFATGKVTVSQSLTENISKGQYDQLYPNEINAIRSIADAGFHVWGARTISPDAEWRYVNVRRLFIFLEQSILRATDWATFEPNDRTLWKTLEGVVSAFLRIQWNEGKLVGDTEDQAFFVKCDAETNPPEVVDAGQVITLIGVAPSKPAEFVIFRIQQLAGQTAT